MPCLQKIMVSYIKTALSIYCKGERRIQQIKATQSVPVPIQFVPLTS